MKKILLTLAAVAAASCASYGQGNISLASTTGLFDDFTTQGTPTKDGNMYVDFIWMAGGGNTLSALGSSATAAGTVADGSWAALSALGTDATGTASGWNWFSATDLAVTGSTPPPAVGQYSGLETFGSGLNSGATITLYVIAWNKAVGNTVAAAEAADSTIGWSAPITYTLGSSTAPGPALGASGSFDVDKVVSAPEPTTLALAGLGGLSMLFLRRRKA